ncbi:MAG: nuclear transport factor 2 family protein [Thermomicrobiales bacterium]
MTETTANGQAQEEALRALERTRLAALVRGDMAVADPLHADDFQLITPLGYVLSKDDCLGGIAAGDLTYRVFEPDGDIAVRLAGPMAVIRYRSRLEVIAEGHLTPLAAYWHTDLYEQRDGAWRIVWSQATAIR